MSDLISRSQLLSFWSDLQHRYGNFATIHSFIESVKNMPTAYDTGEVIKQLKEAQYPHGGFGSWMAIDTDDAVRIVSGGGVRKGEK